MLPFKKKGVENRIKIYTAENNIPYNGFSFYKIVYKGELPAALTKAYRKMNGLNNEAPRKKYKKERKQNREASLKKWNNGKRYPVQLLSQMCESCNIIK